MPTGESACPTAKIFITLFVPPENFLFEIGPEFGGIWYFGSDPVCGIPGVCLTKEGA
jgi:hypothetical protein